MSAVQTVTSPVLLWMDKEKSVRVENVGTVNVLYLSSYGSVNTADFPLYPGYGVEWFGECWGMSVSTEVSVSNKHGDVYQVRDIT